jgi:cytoskeleton protein RodZ
VVDFADSPGRRLRVQRQSRGLTVEAVATRLHLHPEMVEAIEQDRYDALPEPVFITGYLRNYARLLGIDPAPLIAAFQGQAVRQPQGPRSHAIADDQAPDGAGLRVLVSLVSLALIAAVIGIVVMWWQDHASQEADLASAPGQEAAVMGEELDTTQPRELGSVVGSDSLDPGETAAAVERGAPLVVIPGPADAQGDTAAPIQDTTSVASSTPAQSIPSLERTPLATPEPPATTRAPAPEPTAVTTPPTPSAQPAPEPQPRRTIRLEFTGPSWVEVLDASGRQVIIGEMRAGDQREVTGQAPFRLKIGRASNTRVTVGGEPFDILGIARGGVARFSLDPGAIE